ncbi:hypothetical protein ACFE04_022379 [Oxalis oulophora]
MDEEGTGGGGGGEQFHRNEAISAVADDGFLGEEEDEDYEDLYNDVNVGEGFQQYQNKGEDVRLQNQTDNNTVTVKKESVSDNKMLDLASQSNVSIVPVGSVVGLGSSSGGGGGGGLKVELVRSSVGGGISKTSEVEEQRLNVGYGNNENNSGLVAVQGKQLHGSSGLGNMSVENEVLMRQIPAHVGGVANANVVGNEIVPGGFGAGGGGVGGGGGGTMLFVGELHWWTTDTDIEAELVKYGPVKEIKFFDEKASGKSKGYCQVEFYDPGVATACKDGMNGHLFNGRPCVVAFASPFSVKRMGEAQVNRNQTARQAVTQPRRGPNDASAGKNVGGNNIAPGGNNIATGGNYQGMENNNNNNNNRGYGRGNWGRGNQQGMGGRGPVGPRGRGMGGRGMMGNSGNGFGQGMGVTPPMMHPQAMMGQGFDPSFGGPMGRMGSYGGFPGGPTPPFSNVMSPYPPVGGLGLPGVAPHVNPAFFGRGMPMNGMGMMVSSGVDGPNMGMWSDPSMSGWGGEEHGGGRTRESSYGEEAASDHQYGEATHENRGNWQNPMKEKERELSASNDRRYRGERDAGFERDPPRDKDVAHDQDWPERRQRDDRDVGREKSRERHRDRERSRDRDREREKDRDRERDRHREDRDSRYADHHRHRDADVDHDDDWDRGRSSSRTHSKSRITQEDGHRSKSRDADYGKRQRISE